MVFETLYVYDTKQPIFMLPLKDACVGVANEIWKTHKCVAGLCRMKSYCAQSVQVCLNWLHTNTLLKSQKEWTEYLICREKVGAWSWKKIDILGTIFEFLGNYPILRDTRSNEKFFVSPGLRKIKMSSKY